MTISTSDGFVAELRAVRDELVSVANIGAGARSAEDAANEAIDRATRLELRVSNLLEAAAALVLRPSEDWQPIETAPEGYDGTRFNYVLFWGVSAGRSFDHPVVVIGYMDHDRTPVQFYRYKLHITHWRPRPPVPGTEDR